MTTDERALLATIRANPGDTACLLVYADWLEEHEGETWCPDCAGFKGHILHAGNMTRTPANAMTLEYYWLSQKQDWRGRIRTKWQKCPTCSGTGRVSNGFAERARMIRLRVRYDRGEIRRCFFIMPCGCEACELARLEQKYPGGVADLGRTREEE